MLDPPKPNKTPNPMPAKNPQLGTTAGRYAAALLSLAREHNRADIIAANLQNLQKLLANHPKLAQTLKNPSIPLNQRNALLAKLMKKTRFDPLTTSCAGLLLRNRRFHLLKNMSEIFAQTLAEEKGERLVRIISAQPIDEKTQQTLRRHLARALKAKPQDLRLISAEDPSLLGGFRLEIGSRAIDASLSAKLSRFEETLSRPAS